MEFAIVGVLAACAPVMPLLPFCGRCAVRAAIVTPRPSGATARARSAGLASWPVRVS